MISERDIEDWLHYELKEVEKQMEENYWKFSASLCTDKEFLHAYNRNLGAITRILKKLNDHNSN